MRMLVQQPFNYAVGPEVHHYPAGEQDLPLCVAAFAEAQGFATQVPVTAPSAQLAGEDSPTTGNEETPHAPRHKKTP